MDKKIKLKKFKKIKEKGMEMNLDYSLHVSLQ